MSLRLRIAIEQRGSSEARRQAEYVGTQTRVNKLTFENVACDSANAGVEQIQDLAGKRRHRLRTLCVVRQHIFTSLVTWRSAAA